MNIGGPGLRMMFFLILKRQILFKEGIQFYITGQLQGINLIKFIPYNLIFNN